MDLQEIEATIERDGTVSLRVRGVKGTACLDVTRSLEAALGDQVLVREMTPDALESARQDETRREEQRRGT